MSSFRYILHPIDIFISLFSLSVSLLYEVVFRGRFALFLARKSKGDNSLTLSHKTAGKGTERTALTLFVPRTFRNKHPFFSSISILCARIASLGRSPQYNMSSNRMNLGSVSATSRKCFLSFSVIDLRWPARASRRVRCAAGDSRMS